jgi:hypothetical protein
MFFNCEVAPKQIELRAETNVQLNDFKLISDVISCNPSISLSRPIHSSEHRYKSCLAGTVRTKHAKHLSALDSEGEIFSGHFWRHTTHRRVNLVKILNNQRVLVEVLLIYVVNKSSLSLRVSILKGLVIVLERLLIFFPLLLFSIFTLLFQ